MIVGCLPFPTRGWRCGRACYGVGEEPWYVLSHYYSVAALVQYCTRRSYLCMCYNSKGIPTVDHYFVPEILWRESQCPTIVKGIHSAWIIKVAISINNDRLLLYLVRCIGVPVSSKPLCGAGILCVYVCMYVFVLEVISEMYLSLYMCLDRWFFSKVFHFFLGLRQWTH